MNLSNWNIFTKDQDLEIEKAVSFLCEHYNESNINPKPVLIHSLRVATLLDIYNADYRTVMAGVMHDVLEDTKCTPKQITKAFGEEITPLVEACSFNPKIIDYTEQYEEHFSRIVNNKEALLIKTADIIDNKRYLKLGDYDHVDTKHKYFIKIAESVLKDHPLFLQLKAS